MSEPQRISREGDAKISDLDFFDMYLSEEGHCGFIKVVGEGKGSSTPIKELPEIYIYDTQALSIACRIYEEQGHEEYFIRYDNFNYRASVLRSQGGNFRVLRKQPSEVRRLDKLNMHQGIKRMLMLDQLSGLILIAGTTGAGKTTTASSIIVERLHMYGGVAITVEDPPEMPLDGVHGDGRCFQTYANDKTGGFSGALKRCVRQTPDIILLGEIRDFETAKEAINASVNGHLIIATIHAGSITQAIERLISLSETDELRSLLAEGLAMVIYQARTAKIVTFNILSLVDNGRNIIASGLRQKIKKKETHTIKSDSESQMNKIHNGELI